MKRASSEGSSTSTRSGHGSRAVGDLSISRDAVDYVPRKSGRPSSRPPITEEDIAREALAIIDKQGWPACTMKHLAQRLGVRAPSLYHHIEGQHKIVDLVRGVVVREINVDIIVGLPWEEVIVTFGAAYYRAFARHPNTIQVLSMTPVRDDVTLNMYETFLGALTSKGWEVGRAFEAMLGIEHLALGFAYEWNAEDLMLDSSFVENHGAHLLAAATRERTNQGAVAETTFLSLLSRFVEMYKYDFEDYQQQKGPVS